MHSRFLLKSIFSITLCAVLLVSSTTSAFATEVSDTKTRTITKYFNATPNSGATEYTILSENTEILEHTEILDGTEHTENTELPQNTESSESPEDTELPQNTESSESPEDTELPQNTESSESPEDTELPQNTESSESPEDTELPRNTEFPVKTETTETVESSELTDSSVKSDDTEFLESPSIDALKSSSDSFYPNIINGSIIDGYCTYKVTAAEIAKSNAATVIQTALDLAKKNATASVPHKILIEPGTYTLTKSLRIYGNTYLYMEGVTFIQTKSLSTNMLKVGDMYDSQPGYFYENITIDGGIAGGIWDENNNTNTAIKVGHAANFTMKNITIQNTSDAHLMEVAGVKGLTLSGCTLKNQILASKKNYEAIQLDFLLSEHITGYTPENLANQNITIDGCSFINVPRGIGSHTSILNMPVTDLQITNNTFDNNTSSAIQLLNNINCNISGNSITNTPRGIILYAMRGNCEGSFLPSTPANEGGVPTSTPDTYITPPQNQNITISNNLIQLNGSDLYEPSYEEVAIFLGGYNYETPQSPLDGDTIPAGDYYISGATISGNTITTTSIGILLQNTKNTTVNNGNQISFTGNNTSCNGILLRSESAENRIEGNTILNCPGNSISVNSSSTVSSIAANTLIAPTTCGIYVSDSSTVSSVSANVVDSAGYSGIYCTRGYISSITQNTINNGAGNGIYINNGVSDAISQNTIQNPAASGIQMNIATIGSVSQNTITGSGKSGISANICVINNITSNNIQKTGLYGIEHNAGTINTINENYIKNAKNFSIVIYNNASTKNITNNMLVSGKKIGIYISQIASNLKISSNTISKCKGAEIFIDTSATVSSVTVNSNKLTGTSSTVGLKVNSGKVSISGNKIYSNKIAIQLNDTVKGTIKKNTYSKNKTNTVKILSSTSSGSYKKYKNLSTPGSLKASTLSKSSIRLTWKSVKDADGYRIYRSTSPKSGFKKIASVSKKKGTSYTNKKLKKNTKYYYKVVAYKKSSTKNILFLSSDSKVISKKTLKK